MSTSIDFEKLKSRRVLVVGDLMLDRYLWGYVERISPEAPVPVVHIRRRSEIPGGAGNVVTNLVGLGVSVTVIGICGRDSAGERMTDLLSHEQIQSHVLRNADRPTITKTRIIAQGQQMLRLDEEEVLCVDNALQREIIRLVSDCLPECNAVILSDYGKGLLESKRMVQEIISLANEKGTPVIVDPKGKDWERYTAATCVTPNTREIEALSGDKIADEAQLLEAMRATIGRYNLSWLIVTRGALGMCVMDQKGEALFVPTLARQVFDVSGAGDTAIATLTACIVSGYGFRDAAKIANLAAGIVVGKIRTQPIDLSELVMSIDTTGLDAPIDRATQKIVSLLSATQQVDTWKSECQRVVFANGCFDLLHPGHIHLLNQAKCVGERLVVAIHSDASVSRLEGHRRPILAERDRAALVAALDCVDLVVVCDADTPEQVLTAIRPHILVKGSDNKEREVFGRDVVESYGGRVTIVPLLKDYSTTSIRNRVVQSTRCC